MSEKKKPKPAKTDPKAPEILRLAVTDGAGRSWGTITAPAKDFASGSVGFYASEKLTNPESGERYQVGCSLTLIGSKPKE